MKKALSSLVLGLILTTSVPVASAQYMGAQDVADLRFEAIKDGWPKWIGRLTDAQFLIYLYSKKPEMAQKYLPLSLIKTGGFAQLVSEVENTPSVYTGMWPDWIGELAK